MHEEHGFNLLSYIPLLKELPNHVAMTILVCLILVPSTYLARVQIVRAMQRPDGGLVPDSKLTYKNFFEIIAESLFKLTESVIGHHDAPIYFPIIGSLFVFIFTCNIIGLIPVFTGAPTNNLNTTLAL